METGRTERGRVDQLVARGDDCWFQERIFTADDCWFQERIFTADDCEVNQGYPPSKWTSTWIDARRLNWYSNYRTDYLAWKTRYSEGIVPLNMNRVVETWTLFDSDTHWHFCLECCIQPSQNFSFLFLSRSLLSFFIIKLLVIIHIYPTPPLGQDITQGHFLSGV